MENIELELEKDLTFDQGKERQLRWKKTLAKESVYVNRNASNIDDKELLNWLSMYFTIVRKISSIQEI